MKTQDSRSKKWRVVIPAIIIALFVGWYWFRPERLVTNRGSTKDFPRSTIQRHRSLSRVLFIAARTQPREPQRSIASRMAAEFFGSRTSRHQTALTFTFTWWPPKTPGTTQVWNTFRRSGTHQGEHWRPKLHSRLRSRLGEVPDGVCVVQTV